MPYVSAIGRQRLRPVQAPVWADHDNLLHDMRSRGVNKVSRMASCPLKSVCEHAIASARVDELVYKVHMFNYRQEKI